MEGIGYLFCFIWRQLYIATMGAPPTLSGLPNFLVVAICGFFIAVCAGDYDGITSRSGQRRSASLLPSMKKLHLPEQIIIPMSVIFRFFPTVVEEYNAIGDAYENERNSFLAGAKPVQCWNTGLSLLSCVPSRSGKN